MLEGGPVPCCALWYVALDNYFAMNLLYKFIYVLQSTFF